MLARRLSQSSSEQTLPEVVYIFQCCNDLQDIQYDHAGIRLVASLVKLPLTISHGKARRRRLATRLDRNCCGSPYRLQPTYCTTIMTKAGKRVADFCQGASVLIKGRGHQLYSMYRSAYLVFTETISQSNVSVGSASNTGLSLAACLSLSVPLWVRCALLGFIVSCILSYPMQVSGVTATSPAHPRSHRPIRPADATPEVKFNV